MSRSQFILSQEAMEIINRAATERKRGEWISNAIVDYANILAGVDSAGNACGTLEAMESRLDRIEKQLSLIIQRLERQTANANEF